VSANEKITRLQDLLERVQARGPQPREARANGGSSPAYAAPAMAQAAYVAPVSVAPPVEEQYVAPAVAEPDLEMMPVADVASSSPPPPTVDYDLESDMEVEVSSEVIDIDVDMDEPMALESGAQPVAQQTMPPGEMEEDLEPLVAAPVDEPAAELEEVVEATPAPANEIEEPTPSSSRRPIASEAPAAEAYNDESAPRHTPPPESGKQVAAAPSAPPSRNPSLPPPSLEGHTLIGGWREPGLGPQIGPGAGSPVRVPGPGSATATGPTGTEPPGAIAQAQVAPAQPSGTRLSPDLTHPNLPARANVASFEGAVPVAKPKTLGELLDLTLGL
jgi:hypothetical protein